MNEGSVVPCAWCEHPGDGACPRCGHCACPAHRPAVWGAHCRGCEEERRLVSPGGVLLRVPLIAIGAFLGAALGMALSLVVGALVVVADLGLVRILTIASATAGGGAGIAAANTLATTFLRTRAGEQSPDRELPPARVVRPESELKRPL